MIFKLKKVNFFRSLFFLSDKQLLITTLNAHSYNIARKDAAFAEALQQSDVLLPDGISIVLAVRLLKGEKIKKIAGEDLFYWEMNHLEQRAKSQEPRTKNPPPFITGCPLRYHLLQ
jgi:N-acetylglucosaminyldiphosphoundecaprenol N-acetyl-beta-D-mannosaminyltransferase